MSHFKANSRFYKKPIQFSVFKRFLNFGISSSKSFLSSFLFQEVLKNLKRDDNDQT